MDKKHSTDYKREFNAKSYDRLYVTVNKGHKDEIEIHAKKQGESVNSFVNRAIDEAMERDNIKEGE